jgi:hypothetical protein
VLRAREFADGTPALEAHTVQRPGTYARPRLNREPESHVAEQSARARPDQYVAQKVHSHHDARTATFAASTSSNGMVSG